LTYTNVITPSLGFEGASSKSGIRGPCYGDDAGTALEWSGRIDPAASDAALPPHTMSVRLPFARLCALVLVACLAALGCMSLPVRVTRGLSRVHVVVTAVGRSRSSRDSRGSEELRAPLASEAAAGGFMPYDDRGDDGPGGGIVRIAASARASRSPRDRASTPRVLRI
jgi:hypothetical protein